MKLLIAGASGEIGSQLVPQLAAGGPEAVGRTRSAAKTGALRARGGGVWSKVHITDAALAAVAAIDRRKPGIYHVAHDEPAPVRDWPPDLARALGAKPPRRVPARLVRWLAGETAVNMMTQARGASNEKTKRELDRARLYPSWRTGINEGSS